MAIALAGLVLLMLTSSPQSPMHPISHLLFLAAAISSVAALTGLHEDRIRSSGRAPATMSQLLLVQPISVGATATRNRSRPGSRGACGGGINGLNPTQDGAGSNWGQIQLDSKRPNSGQFRPTKTMASQFPPQPATPRKRKERLDAALAAADALSPNSKSNIRCWSQSSPPWRPPVPSRSPSPRASRQGARATRRLRTWRSPAPRPSRRPPRRSRTPSPTSRWSSRRAQASRSTSGLWPARPSIEVGKVAFNPDGPYSRVQYEPVGNAEGDHEDLDQTEMAKALALNYHYGGDPHA